MHETARVEKIMMDATWGLGIRRVAAHRAPSDGLGAHVPAAAGRFLLGISREVVWRRLLTLGRISPSVYRQKRAELQRCVRKLRSTDGGPSPAVLAVSDLSRPFVRLVVAGYHQDILTGSDVAEYLGVRWKHIAKIEAAVRDVPT